MTEKEIIFIDFEFNFHFPGVGGGVVVENVKFVKCERE